MTDGPAGYAHPRYLASLSEFGTPLWLHRAGGGLLVRDVPGSGLRDAIGAYPVFSCERFDVLAGDIAALPSDIIAVSLVTDPFGRYDRPLLESGFDFVRVYKEHYLVDLQVEFENYMHRHHRRYSKRALDFVAVEHVGDPAAFAEEWFGLYQNLCARHAIAGIRAFSLHAFALQMSIPGCHYFRASSAGELVGGLICYLCRDTAYAHLISTTEKGQELLAQYALYWRAIEFFRRQARWFNLGSVPGATNTAASGLAFFKAGWATSTRPAYFCGKILDGQRYAALCTGVSRCDDFFPAYRRGCFA